MIGAKVVQMSSLFHRVEKIMTDDGSASFFSFASLLLMISFGYRSALWFRNLCLRSGLSSSKKLSCKVISIGNLTVGGTGKTPMSMFVAESVKKMDYKVAILSRGYGGKAEKKGGIVSDGKTLYMESEQAGDEAFLMASRLEGIPIFVGKDRYTSGRTAIREFGAEVLVLDDAFQHRCLKRDIDLVLLDEQRPFGNRKLLPRGRLREPVSEINRADAVILTRSRGNETETVSLIKKMEPKMPVFRSSHQPVIRAVIQDSESNESKPVNKDNRQASLLLKGKAVFAFSGIASNIEFQETIGTLGSRLVGSLTFADHHKYSPEDFQTIFRHSRDARAELLATTEKDFARLGLQLPKWPMDLMVIGIDINFVPDEQAFIAFLKSRLEGETEYR